MHWYTYFKLQPTNNSDKHIIPFSILNSPFTKRILIMKEIIIECIASTVACVAFGIQFNIRPFNLGVAALGALISQVISIAMERGGASTMLTCFIASAAVAAYSEIAARRFKAPANMYLIIGIIPLVPGGAIYRTMISLISGNGTQAFERGLQAFGAAGAIAMGIFAISAIGRLVIENRK